MPRNTNGIKNNLNEVVGSFGTVIKTIAPGTKGKVKAPGGVFWTAVSEEALIKGDEIVVSERVGLVLKVRRAS